MLGPEPGVPDPAALAPARPRVEPVAVRMPCVPAGLPQGDRSDLSQPRPLRGLLGQGDDPSLYLSVGELLTSLVGAFPLARCVVVDHPGASERSGQRLALPGRRG